MNKEPETLQEALGNLKRELVKLFPDMLNLYAGLFIGMAVLAVLGIWEDRLIIIGTAFGSAFIGYIIKPITRVFPVEKYFR